MDAGHRAGQGRAVPDTGLQGFRAFTVLPSVDRRACCADFSSCFLLPAPGLQSSGGLVSGCLRRKRRQRSARCWQSASTARQPRRPGRAQSSHCAGPLCAGRHQGCRGRKRCACKTCRRFGPSPVPPGHRLDLPDPRCKRPAGVRPGIGQRIAGQGGRHAQSGAVLAARHHFQRGRNPKQPCRRLGRGGGGGLTGLHCAGAQRCRPWRQQRHAAPLPVFGAHGGIAGGLSDRRQNLAPVA